MDLSKHLEKADEAVRRKSYPQAIILYQQILDLNPGYAAARKGLREALDGKFAGKKSRGNVLSAIQGFLPLLSARIAGMSRNHASRIRNLERFLAIAPHNPGANVALGDALERGGWNEAAQVVFAWFGRHVAKDGKTSPDAMLAADALRRAGVLAQGLQQFEEAMECFELALELNPRDQEALRARKNLSAERALHKGGYETAEHSRALIRDKEAHAELEKAQRLHRSEDEIRDDLASLEKKLAQEPQDEVLLVKVGDLRARAGDVAGALDCYETLLGRRPGDFALLVKVGDLRLRDTENELAKARKLEDEAQVAILEERLARMRIEELRKRIEAHPTDLGLRHELGKDLLAIGSHDEAIAELQRSVKDPRHKLDALLLLGKSFKAKGMTDLARSQFDKARSELGPSDDRYKELCYEIGCLAEEAGDHGSARTEFTKILEQDIGYRDVADRLSQLGA